MSVINSVLKDLESRGNRFTPIDIQAVPRAAAPARERRSWWLSGLLLLALAGACAFILYQQSRLQLVEAPPVAVPVSPVVAAVTPAPPAPAQSAAADTPRNEILGLQFSEENDGMRMDFVLRERAVAFLRERGEHFFSYHLRDVDSRVEAPLMRDNPWIVALEIQPRDGGVDVSFETGADVLVDTRQQRGEGEVLWSVSLRRALPEPAEAVRIPDAEPVSRPLTAADPVTEPALPASESAAPVEPATPTIAASTIAAPAAQPPVEVRVDIRSSDPRAQSAERLAYAVELINSGRHADAEALLRSMFDGEHGTAAREHLLALYASLGRQDRFARLARESMLLLPNHDLFATEYARSLVAARAYREAVELLSARSRLVPAQQALLGAAYQRLDRHVEAVRHYRLALDADPRDARNWVGLGISLEHTAALAEALEAYRKAGRLGQLNDRLQAFVARRSEALLQVIN